MAESSSHIDQLRDGRGRLDRSAIRTILPYGEDFLFIDRVERLTASQIEASYTIRPELPFLRAHFEGLPIMPGSLVGEALAQAGTLLVRYNLEDHRGCDLLAYQIDAARFPAPAQPGDTLRLQARLTNLRRRAARLDGQATVGRRRVCTARLVLAIVEREGLRTELAKLAER